jgi:uncharacterized protein YaeQ
MLRINLDADLTNADWTKQSWDLPAHNVQDLRAWLKDQGTSVAAFKRLPVYKLNVEKLPWLKKL